MTKLLAALAVVLLAGCSGRAATPPEPPPTGGLPPAHAPEEETGPEEPEAMQKPGEPDPLLDETFQLPEVERLADDREPTWEGSLGSLDELRWMIVTTKQTYTPGEGLTIEQTPLLVFKKGPEGLEWVYTCSDGEFAAADDVVVTTHVDVIEGEGPDGAPVLVPVPSWTEVEYQPVPDAAAKLIGKVYEGTPLPASSAPPGEELMTVELSTETVHVKAAFKDTVVMFLSPGSPLPAMKKVKTAKSLPDLASRVQELLMAAAYK